MEAPTAPCTPAVPSVAPPARDESVGLGDRGVAPTSAREPDKGTEGIPSTTSPVVSARQVQERPHSVPRQAMSVPVAKPTAVATPVTRPVAPPVPSPGMPPRSLNSPSSGPSSGGMPPGPSNPSQPGHMLGNMPPLPAREREDAKQTVATLLSPMTTHRRVRSPAKPGYGPPPDQAQAPRRGGRPGELIGSPPASPAQVTRRVMAPGSASAPRLYQGPNGSQPWLPQTPGQPGMHQGAAFVAHPGSQSSLVSPRIAGMRQPPR